MVIGTDHCTTGRIPDLNYFNCRGDWSGWQVVKLLILWGIYGGVGGLVVLVISSTDRIYVRSVLSDGLLASLIGSTDRIET